MRAYIAEDSKVVLDRLVLLLEEVDGLEIVGQTGSFMIATENILQLQPDVALIDIRLSDGNGLDVLAEIRASGLKTTCMVMTFHPCPKYRKQAMEHGAAFFIDKAKDLEKIPVVLEQMIAARRSACERE